MSTLLENKGAVCSPCLTTWSGARFSPCRTWRYTLHRVWDQGLGLLMVIGLNPSTADEVQNDPTVARCVNYAKSWGFGGLVMMNAFAYRTTFPGVLKKAPDPVGPDNDFWLRRMAEEARQILAAWGNHGRWLDRQGQVLSLIDRELYCLGETKEGAPRHPLYLRKDAEPRIFRRKK
jgi:hypothetical protein